MTRLLVKGIDDRINPSELEDVLAKYGKVVEIKSIGKSKAIVEYQNEKEAKIALTELNGAPLGDDKLIVEKADDEKPSTKDDDSPPRRYSPSSPRQSHKRDFRCYNCNRSGHLARDCSERPRNPMYLDTRGTVNPEFSSKSGGRFMPYSRRSPPYRGGYGGYSRRGRGSGYRRDRSPDSSRRSPYNDRRKYRRSASRSASRSPRPRSNRSRSPAQQRSRSRTPVHYYNNSRSRGSDYDPRYRRSPPQTRYSPRRNSPSFSPRFQRQSYGDSSYGRYEDREHGGGGGGGRDYRSARNDRSFGGQSQNPESEKHVAGKRSRTPSPDRWKRNSTPPRASLGEKQSYRGSPSRGNGSSDIGLSSPKK